MAEKEKETTGTASPAAVVASAAKNDLVTEIGTLTYPRAVQHFGKDLAIPVMQRVAALGGHGLFDEAELKSPLFGGLAMPAAEKVGKPLRTDFDKYGEDAEFFFGDAMDEYEVNKGKAVEARAKINEYFTSLK